MKKHDGRIFKYDYIDPPISSIYTPRRNIVNLGEVSNVVNVSMSVVLGGE